MFNTTLFSNKKLLKEIDKNIQQHSTANTTKYSYHLNNKKNSFHFYNNNSPANDITKIKNEIQFILKRHKSPLTFMQSHLDKKKSQKMIKTFLQLHNNSLEKRNKLTLLTTLNNPNNLNKQINPKNNNKLERKINNKEQYKQFLFTSYLDIFKNHQKKEINKQINKNINQCINKDINQEEIELMNGKQCNIFEKEQIILANKLYSNFSKEILISKTNFNLTKFPESKIINEQQLQLGMGKILFGFENKFKIKRKDLIQNLQNMKNIKRNINNQNLQQLKYYQRIQKKQKQDDLLLPKFYQSIKSAQLYKKALQKEKKIIWKVEQYPQQRKKYFSSKSSLQTIKYNKNKLTPAIQVCKHDSIASSGVILQQNINHHQKETKNLQVQSQEKSKNISHSLFEQTTNNQNYNKSLNVVDQQLLVYYGRLRKDKSMTFKPNKYRSLSKNQYYKPDKINCNISRNEDGMRESLESNELKFLRKSHEQQNMKETYQKFSIFDPWEMVKMKEQDQDMDFEEINIKN